MENPTIDQRENNILRFNQQGYNDNLKHLKKFEIRVQETVASFNEIANLEDLQPSEFGMLFTNPKKLVFKKMTKGKEAFAGPELDEDFMFAALKKPAGYDRFMLVVGEMPSFFEKNNSIFIQPKSVGEIESFFEVDEKGNVAIKEAVLNQVREKYEDRLKTKDAHLVNDFGKDILKMAEERGLKPIVFMKYPMPNGFSRFLSELLIINSLQEPAVNIDVVRRFNND
jgi:hypothetical protein